MIVQGKGFEPITHHPRKAALPVGISPRGGDTYNSPYVPPGFVESFHANQFKFKSDVLSHLTTLPYLAGNKFLKLTTKLMKFM